MVSDIRKIGQAGLIEAFALRGPPPAVESTVGSGTRQTRIEGGRRFEHYTRQYDPGDAATGHLRFALRHEPLDMGVMVAVMRALDPAEVVAWVRAEPTGQYSRRAWFLYEWATGTRLDLPDAGGLNYVPALDPAKHVTGAPIRSLRHKVLDNLPGVPGYCPTIRRTGAIEAAMARHLDQRGRDVLEGCPADLLARAVNYLFTKETRTSFEIEHETPAPGKAERFVACLHQAGQVSIGSQDDLIGLQQAIVDPRYAATGLWDFQNFVGETVGFDYEERVHFICPRPEDLPDLMAAWQAMSARMEGGIDPVVAAALVAFGLVFLHPFEDGNGRLHRFLIHKVLSDRGFTPPGMLFPVSASILRDRHGYDRCLEAFSALIQPWIDWSWQADRTIVVGNETADLYRYYDATPQVEYLFDRIADTIEVDLKEELSFIQRFDAALQAVNRLIDMPNRRAQLFVQLVLQNSGRLSAGKRGLFAELTDSEIARLEAAVAAESASG